MSRHAGAAPTLARVLGVWLVLASLSADAQDAPATPTAQPAPQPSTDTELQAPSPKTVPVDAQGELTPKGGVAALNDGRYAQAGAAPREVWYGWQTVIVDLSAIALVAAGVNSASNGDAGLVVFGAAIYGLGPPIVHWAHSEVGRGFGSLGLRVGLPLLFAYIGSASEGCQQTGRDLCGLGGGLLGGALGIVTAVIIDAGVLARTTKQPQSKVGSAARAGFAWRVYAAPTPSRDGMAAGVSGRL